MTFKMTITDHEGYSRNMICELKDYLYEKLTERINSRYHIANGERYIQGLDESYKNEINTILKYIKVI